MFSCMVVIILQVYFCYCGNSCYEKFEVTTDTNGAISLKSKQNGDYIFQTLMTLSEDEKCDVITSVGLFRIYAVKYAIEKINAENSILPNITLGYEIFDACNSLPNGMARGLDIIRGYRQTTCKLEKKTCSSNYQGGQNVAVIGGYYSFISLPLASLMSLYSIPQISYGSSSPLLSKKNLYPSFYRTLPSDKNQVDVFIEILKVMDWTYIFTVASDDDYGKLAVSYLKKETSKNSICLAGVKYIPWNSDNTEKIIVRIVKAISKESKAQVVLMFGYAKNMADILLREAEKQKLQRFWLTSEGWNPHILNVNAPKNQLKSVLTVSLAKKKIPDFSTYLSNKFFNVSECDHWIKEFIEERKNCSFSKTGKKICNTSYPDLFEDVVEQDPNQISNLIDAVKALAYGLKLTIDDSCRNNSSNLTCKPHIEVAKFTKRMSNVSFYNEKHSKVAFDINGDLINAMYNVENIQIVNNKLKYVKVGSWDSSHDQKLILNISEIIWPLWFDKRKSECAPKCEKGHYLTGKTGCCWVCRKCDINEISNQTNAGSCYSCAKGYRTLDNIECKQIQTSYVNSTSVIGALMIVFSVIGALFTLFSIVVFQRLKLKEPIKNTSTLVICLSFLILMLKFSYVPFSIIKPTEGVCLSKNIFQHIDLILSVALLFIQNKSSSNFVAKFFTRYKQGKLVTRLVVMGVIVSIQIVILVFWINKTKMKISTIQTGGYFSLYNSIQCEFDFSIYTQMLYFYPAIILAIASAIAFSERNHPNQLFNDAKYLNYCCLSSCILMIAELLVLQALTGDYLAAVLSLTLNGYGYVYILCILVPKMYYSLILKVLIKVKTKKEVINKAYVVDEDEEQSNK